MRIAFRASQGGGESEEGAQTAWGDSYMTFFGADSGDDELQPPAYLTFFRGFTGWNCSESGRVEGWEIHLRLHDERSSIDYDGPVVVRRCRLGRRLLSIDIEPLEVGREILEGFDVELLLDGESWGSLRWGARELFKGTQDVLHVEEVEVAEEGSRVEHAEDTPPSWPVGHDPWVDDNGDIPF